MVEVDCLEILPKTFLTPPNVELHFRSALVLKLNAQIGKKGQIQKVDISYPTDVTQQYLVYGSMYDSALAPSAKCGKKPNVAHANK